MHVHVCVYGFRVFLLFLLRNMMNSRMKRGSVRIDQCKRERANRQREAEEEEGRVNRSLLISLHATRGSVWLSFSLSLSPVFFRLSTTMLFWR